MATCAACWDPQGAGHRGWQKERPRMGSDHQREDLLFSLTYSLIQYLQFYIFQWVSIECRYQPNFPYLSPQVWSLVYPKFQPPWDNSTWLHPVPEFSQFGEVQVVPRYVFNFLKLEMSFISLWWLILHLYLKGDDLFLGEDYIITASSKEPIAS